VGNVGTSGVFVSIGAHINLSAVPERSCTGQSPPLAEINIGNVVSIPAINDNVTKTDKNLRDLMCALI
jgi:hypothetical protein